MRKKEHQAPTSKLQRNFKHQAPMCAARLELDVEVWSFSGCWSWELFNMPFSTKSAAENRGAFRTALKSGKLLRFPGAFSPLVAMAIQRHGFNGVCISGAAR